MIYTLLIQCLSFLNTQTLLGSFYSLWFPFLSLSLLHFPCQSTSHCPLHFLLFISFPSLSASLHARLLIFIYIQEKFISSPASFLPFSSESQRAKMSAGSKSKLQNIKEEDIPATWTCPPPETPTKSMEFLARSWSLSAMELSKALSHTDYTVKDAEKFPLFPLAGVDSTSFMASSEAQQQPHRPPTPPRGSDDTKELFLLHQALNPEFLSNQQLLRNGLYRNIMRGKTMGRWIKDQKERRKHELRTQNAQLHAAVSVAGVAAAVAALVASTLTSPETSVTQQKATSRTSTALATAAALVASHCIEIAEDMGADNEQILTAVTSAINAKTNGDIMTLTAGAATALRGAATLRARLQNRAATISLLEEQVDEGKDSNYSPALNFVSRGGELLKRTRKGDLHWKEVSFKISSNWQVVAKMKSKHMAGTFTKKKKFVVSAVYYDIPAWPGREREDSNERRAYFGIKASERIIEFECRNKGDKLIWIEGIQNMLDCRANV